MKKTRRAFMMLLLCALFAFMYKGNCKAAIYGREVLQTDVQTASAGNTLVGLEGSYADDVEAAVKLVNKYRLEACENGYPDPRDSDKKLTTDDYVPIQWSSDLEYIARIRAAEASVYFEHERPTGNDCFSIKSENGVSSYAEVLAAAGSSICNSVRQWYSEKDTWVKQGNGITGHYTSMIDPDTTYMGMANFEGTGAGEFTNEEWNNLNGDDGETTGVTLDTTPMKKAKNVIQVIEVPTSALSKLKQGISSKKLTVGESGSLSLYYTYKGNKVYYLGNVNWSSSSKKIAVKQDGTFKAKKIGKHAVKIKYTGDVAGSFTVKVKVLPRETSIKKTKALKNSIKVSLKKTAGITGYQIQLYSGSEWNPTKKTVTVSRKKAKKAVEITGLKRKTKYWIYVRTYKTVKGKKYYSGRSKGVKVKTK